MASPILPGAGLGSGLDTTAIVKALVGADTAPKQNQITKQSTANDATISAIGTLKSALAAYKTALDKLNSGTTPAFAGFAATSSDEKIIKATSDNTAVNGSYVIKVDKMATASKVASASFVAGNSSPITAGTLKVSQNGTDYNVDIPSGATLLDARDAINKELQTKGFSANIINDGSGSRLVVSSTTTGKGSDISLSGIPELVINGTTAMTPTGAGYISAKADDAQFSIDGLAMTSKSNTVSSAVSGLSFNVLNTGTSTVTVATNTEGLKASVQSFVDAYNTLIKTVNSLTKTSIDADGNPVRSALSGDAMARSLVATVRKELVVAGSGDQLTVLSQLGIKTTQSDGTLEFNSTEFTSALNDKKFGSQIQALFTGTDGLVSRMTKAIDPYTTSGGVLESRSSILTAKKTNLTEQQAALDRRIESLTATLSKKYNAMDLLVGQLKATSSNVMTTLNALNNQKND
ncbi:Flagellar hook-associated protein 2 [compost metagenome]